MALITDEGLREYLGADPEADIASFLESALEELQRATGVDWRLQEKTGVANEAIRTIAYLSYYGMRGAAQNLDHLRRHKIELITQLQYSPEAAKDDV